MIEEKKNKNPKNKFLNHQQAYELEQLEKKIYKPETEDEVKNSGLIGDRYSVEEDGTNELMKNLAFCKNQLCQEILESFGEEMSDPESVLDDIVDTNPDYSITYDNPSYVDEEYNYVMNKLGQVPDRLSINKNKSIGDLVVEWYKNGQMPDKNPGQTVEESFSDFNFDFSSIKGKGWDVQRACEWLQSNAYPRYTKGVCGHCAKYVRMAIEAGGISTAGRPVNAKDYVYFLPKIGFKHYKTIKYDAAVARLMQNDVLPGDIAVYQKPSDPGSPGHICMFTGKQWASDFKQNSIWAYGGQCGLVYVFRYAGITVNGGTPQLGQGGMGLLASNITVSPGGKLAGAAGRNNNPGNITCASARDYYGQVGKDGRWPTFKNIVYGIRCWFSYIERKRPSHNSIRKLWYMYAPPNENNTQAYVAGLARATGMSADAPLPPVYANKKLYWTLARACFKFECGYSPPDNVMEIAWNMFMENPRLK